MKNALISFKNNHPKILIFIISIFLAALLAFSSSAINNPFFRLFSSSSISNDTLYFFYCGKMMTLGKKPYIDIYDHKGLYIFFYQALANLMGGRFGSFLLSTIVFTFTFFMFFLTAKTLKIKTTNIVIGTSIFFITYTMFFQGGSDTELLFPFLITSLFFYIKGIKEESNKYFLLGNMFIGIVAGIALNIRASDAIVPLSLVFFYAFYIISKKQAIQLLPNAAICLGGIFVAFVPVLSYVLINNMTKIWFDTAFMANFSYISNKQSAFDFNAIISLIVLLCGIAASLLMLLKLRKKIGNTIFISSIIALAICSIFEFFILGYVHYFLIFLTPFVILLMIFCDKFINYEKHVSLPKWFNATAIALSVISITFNPIRNAVADYKKDVAITEYVNYTIPELSRNEKVIVFDMPTSLYLNSNMICYKEHFSCQTIHAEFNEEIKNQTYSYITSGEVDFFIFESNSKSMFYEFVKNHYTFMQNEKTCSYIEIYRFN